MQSSLQKLRLPFTTFLLKLRRIVVNLYYYPPDFVEQENTKVEIRGQWYKYVADTQGMVQLNDQWSNNFARIGKEIRDDFKKYFNSVPGSVPWQEMMVNGPENVFDEQILEQWNYNW